MSAEFRVRNIYLVLSLGVSTRLGLGDQNEC